MSTIFWCRGCGFEDTRDLGACGNCGQALASSNLAWLNDGDMGEETVYELSLSEVQRSGLVEALITDEIRHRWDSPGELVVATSEEEATDVVIDDVLHEEVEVVGDDATEGDSEIDADELEPVDGGGGEEAYQAMSQLFFSADRLLKKWEEDDVGTYIADATAVTMMSAPLGMEDDDWAEIQSMARNSSLALQENGEADVEDDVTDLRDRLKALI